jgi:hypothetical protein
MLYYMSYMYDSILEVLSLCKGKMEYSWVCFTFPALPPLSPLPDLDTMTDKR